MDTPYTCNFCNKYFQSYDTMMTHIEETCCVIDVKTSLLRNTFGEEDIELVINDLSTFSSVYSIVKSNKNLISDMVDLIYFNPLFPQNQTIKYIKNSNLDISTWSGQEWVEYHFNDITPNVIKNVELVYVAFFNELNQQTNMDKRIVLDPINRICNIIFKHFKCDCDSLEEVELNILEEYKNELLKTSYQRANEFDNFNKLLKLVV